MATLEQLLLVIVLHSEPYVKLDRKIAEQTTEKYKLRKWEN